MPDSVPLMAVHEQPQEDAHGISMQSPVHDNSDILQQSALVFGILVKHLRHQQRGCMLVRLPAHVERLGLAHLRRCMRCCMAAFAAADAALLSA